MDKKLCQKIKGNPEICSIYGEISPSCSQCQQCCFHTDGKKDQCYHEHCWRMSSSWATPRNSTTTTNGILSPSKHREGSNSSKYVQYEKWKHAANCQAIEIFWRCDYKLTNPSVHLFWKSAVSTFDLSGSCRLCDFIKHWYHGFNWNMVWDRWWCHSARAQSNPIPPGPCSKTRESSRRRRCSYD